MAEYMGEYKIIRKMDGGGNANVFVAENVRGEAVAIKILREESGNGKRTEKRNRKKRIRFKIETEMVVGIQDEIEGVIPIFLTVYLIKEQKNIGTQCQLLYLLKID